MKTPAFVAFAALFLACTSAFAAPFTVSADFSEVTDIQTGLIWRRCVEGASLTATGDCTGTHSVVNHEAALGIAKIAASSSGKAWRLPNVRELGSLVSIDTAPAVDGIAFPNDPTNAMWTSSPIATKGSHVWGVDSYSGFIFEESRVNSNRLRLVRTGP